MKIPIIDPLGIIKKPVEDTLRAWGVDVELSDPFREFALGVVEGLQGGDESKGVVVFLKPPYDPNTATRFADAVCSSAKRQWTSGCRNNVMRIVEMWLTDPEITDEKFNQVLPDAAVSILHNVDYAAQYRAMTDSTHEREAYLEFGKRAITFDCTRCQAIAEEVAAEYAPGSPKKQLECMYYIKMFDENELGTDGYAVAKSWLEEHSLKDKLYAAYLTELGVQG